MPEGYRVRYRYHRLWPAELYEYGVTGTRVFPPQAKGGETEARIYGPDDSLIALGIATCHERDNFCRRIGRDIALGRALKQLDRKAVER